MLGKFERLFHREFSHEAGSYKGGARIENGSRDLYRPMDSQALVYAQREASPPRRVAPPPRKRLAAHAHQNSPQSRIAGLIARRVTTSRAIAVEYSLTQQGKTIIAPLKGMCRWAKRFRRQVSADVHFSKQHEVQ